MCRFNMGTQEVWKPVEGYEGLYEVSNLGNVRSLDRYVNHWQGGKCLKRGKLLAFGYNAGGYRLVKLCDNGRERTHKVHRLVAQAFIPNPENLPWVNHKDENPANNTSVNLEWCTPKYNANYGTLPTRKSINSTNHKATSKAVQMIRDGEVVAIFSSLNQIERELGYGHGNISKCCNGKLPHAYGYEWRFAG